MYADALPAKAALHVWDLVLWSAHSSDASVGPGAPAGSTPTSGRAEGHAAAAEVVPLVHPARCVLLWVALGLAAAARGALADANSAGGLTLEGALRTLQAAAAQAGELGEMQGPELEDVATKAHAIAAKVVRDQTAAASQKQREEAKGEVRAAADEEEEEEESSAAEDEQSSALAALEALAQSDSSEEASEHEVEEEDAPDDLAVLLTEFGLEALYAALASAARGKSAQQLLALGQKEAVALGVPFIKARKLWAKAEAVAVQAQSQAQFGAAVDALRLSPVRETALPSRLPPEAPVDQRDSDRSTQPASVLSPETPVGWTDSSTGGLNSPAKTPRSQTQTSSDAAEESTDELAALLMEFGLVSLQVALATAAKGTSARQLLALGQKEAVALGVPFIKARKLWAKAEAVAAASPAVTNAAGPHEASSGLQSKWKVAAKEAVEMRHEDEAAAAEMSARVGLVVAPAAAPPTKLQAKGQDGPKRHFADVVMDAFEASALAAVSARMLSTDVEVIIYKLREVGARLRQRTFRSSNRVILL